MREREDLTARIEALLGIYRLPKGCGTSFRKLLELLEADLLPATKVRSASEAVDVHLADSLAGLLIDELRSAALVVDIGSGAGFPGLPLSIACDGSRYELLEATGRKLDFAGRAVERLGLENVGLIAERAEDWARAGGGCRYRAAVSRAVGSLATVLEYGAPLLEEGGVLVVWRGRREAEEEEKARAAASELGMKLSTVMAVEPYRGSKNRHLHLYRKVEQTPPRFPRRPGMAKKRSLGQSAGG